MPALRALRAIAPPLALAAQRGIGGFLAAAGEVDQALDFETLGLSALFVADGSPPRVPALAAAARVVCWFGAGDATFERRLRELAPGAVLARPAPSVADAAPVRWPDDDRPLVWEHLRSAVAAPPVADERRPVAVPPRFVDEAQTALRAAGWDGATPFVLLHPGAGGTAKRWPAQGFARVLHAMTRSRGLGAVVHRGPADADAAAALAASLTVLTSASPAPPRAARFPEPPVVVLGEPSLGVLAGALRLARLYVGNDSGVSHLAAAVGAHSVIVFTRALWPWRPWWPDARLVAVDAAALALADVEAVRDAALAALG